LGRPSPLTDVLLTQDVGAKLLNFFFQKVQDRGIERVKTKSKAMNFFFFFLYFIINIFETYSEQLALLVILENSLVHQSLTRASFKLKLKPPM